MAKKKYRVVVLDDDEQFCQQLAELLEDIAKVSYFIDPLLLLNNLEKPYPDLLLVDLNLNHQLSGLDVIAKIKQAEDSHLLPIIMISGADDSEILEKAFRSGIDDYILKPFMPVHFIHKVENAIFTSKKRIHLNALTGLPGNYVIEERYAEFLQLNRNFSVAYLDLDNFKPFNDTKGVKTGDLAIRLIADILKSLRTEYTPERLFVGHLGGDDFFMIGHTSDIKNIIQQAYEQWQTSIFQFFSPEEITQGYYSGKNRRGKEEEIELLTISTVILELNQQTKFDFLKLTELASVEKKEAKAIQGNSVVFKKLKPEIKK